MSAPVNFKLVRDQVSRGRDWIDLASAAARMGHDGTEYQQKGAAELRAAADRLDPPAGSGS